jgi:hypothetical protein
MAGRPWLCVFCGRIKDYLPNSAVISKWTKIADMNSISCVALRKEEEFRMPVIGECQLTGGK